MELNTKLSQRCWLEVKHSVQDDTTWFHAIVLCVAHNFHKRSEFTPIFTSIFTSVKSSNIVCDGCDADA